MRSLSKFVELLQEANFFQVQKIEQSTINGLKFLENGKNFTKILKQHWQKDHVGWPTIYTTSTDPQCLPTERYAFPNSSTFQNNLTKLLKSTKTPYPSIIKTTYETNVGFTKNAENSIKLTESSHNKLYLISDYLIRPAFGFEHFSTIQRKQKIWWMHLTANSSRYFFQSIENSVSEHFGIDKCSSVTIKARFPFGNIDVEELMYVPLKSDNFKSLEFQSKLEEREKSILPTIVRSVIDIEAASLALLFDSCDHERINTLKINRKLAPFQCLVICSSPKFNTGLDDLCAHISNEIDEAGMRVLYSKEVKRKPVEKILYADSVGIPYTILIEENSLKTGLLGLRNRDTTLQETIHLSDIPGYLLNIFKC